MILNDLSVENVNIYLCQNIKCVKSVLTFFRHVIDSRNETCMNPAHKGSLVRETNGKDKEQYIHTWRNKRGLQRCLEVEFLWYSLSSS